MDPKDLNYGVQREHYSLPTIEDIATSLHGAKHFTILEVQNSFWHIGLDEKSYMITTFNTPFGQYRWKRLPFGISSVPDVFKRRMHQLVEGLSGVEVIADGFVVLGFGDSMEDAIQNHDQNLCRFLQRCEQKHVHLNSEKLQLHKTEVPFIGHVATGDGLKIHPDKVQAILEMPDPGVPAAIHRLIGMVTYLAKFVPRLSDITELLRELIKCDTEWVWDYPQKKAFQKLKGGSCVEVLFVRG